MSTDTKIRSARVSIFCLACELRAWIANVFEKEELCLILYKTYKNPQKTDKVPAEIDPQWPRIFLCPRTGYIPSDLSFSHIKPVDWGWIDIEPGGLTQTDKNLLKISKICLKCAISKAASWRILMELKKEIRGGAEAGAIGTNPITRGQSIYRNMWHTAAARQKLKEGTLWKHSLDANSTFEPFSVGGVSR